MFEPNWPVIRDRFRVEQGRPRLSQRQRARHDGQIPGSESRTKVAS